MKTASVECFLNLVLKNWENETGTKELIVRSIKTFKIGQKITPLEKEISFYICKVWSQSNPFTTNFLEKYHPLAFYYIIISLFPSLLLSLHKSWLICQTWPEEQTNIHIKFGVFLMSCFKKNNKVILSVTALILTWYMRGPQTLGYEFFIYTMSTWKMDHKE